MAFRKLALFAALAAALAFGAGESFARPGGGSSFGSRGGKTYSAPPATRTAPNSASPVQRSITPPTPSAINPARTPGGFGRGLLGGLLGAGLIGMLLGHGLSGGLGGLTSMLGLLLQVGLIFLLIRFALGFFRRSQPAHATSTPGGLSGAAYTPAPGASFGGGAQPKPLQIVKTDFDAFERRLGEVEAAFSSEDVGTLRRICTPEVAAHLEQELSDNAARGMVNRVTGVRLVQGDLAESWRETDGEYATVAMRFSLNDVMVERQTGRVVSGSSTIPEEVTELWTFRRQPGADSTAWVLSAMQQAA